MRVEDGWHFPGERLCPMCHHIRVRNDPGVIDAFLNSINSYTIKEKDSVGNAFDDVFGKIEFEFAACSSSTV